ncbi:hypothetical protein P8Q88_06165 [Qipengyuania sp. XHP0207]|uniref:CC_3452 family protein n=1 Tax=Qipengyuania sp. XHP0207 TaxID=3038078 RepID=UPI00241E058F|nr:hypothetical protein [Qipengyuania sp. XHP0207]MDG5747760.1 hypothetical protein [Qipengyuania sp. XHP0207]
MTLSLPRSINLAAIVGAVAWTTASFGAAIIPAPAAAASSQPYYTAELAQPAAERTVVAGGVAWNCTGTTCIAPKGNSRPMRVCRELQREHGAIAGFTAKGEALADDKLAKCNR